MSERSSLPDTADVFIEIAVGHFRDYGPSREVMRNGLSEHDRFRAYFAFAARPEAMTRDPRNFDQQPIDTWYCASRAENVMQRAIQGDAEAHEALRMMYNRFDVEGAVIPPALSHHCVYITPKRRRGAPVKDDVRDMVIVLVIALLERSAIPPTRNPSLREVDPPTSGCSIVRHALWREYELTLTDSAIEKIWEKRDKADIADIVSVVPELDSEWCATIRAELRAIRPN